MDVKLGVTDYGQTMPQRRRKIRFDKVTENYA